MFNPLPWVLLFSFMVLVGIFLLLRKRRFLWAILLFLLGAGSWYGYREYTRTNRDIAEVRPDFSIAASSLVKEFEINDTIANRKYLGKIIESQGMVKEVKKDEPGNFTLVLGDTASLSSLRCSLDTAHQVDPSLFRQGLSVTVRGACTGFLKDELGLGSDVILNRCVVIDLNEKK